MTLAQRLVRTRGVWLLLFEYDVSNAMSERLPVRLAQAAGVKPTRGTAAQAVSLRRKLRMPRNR